MEKLKHLALNFDYATLKTARQQYYEIINMVDNPKSRKRDLMLARHAFCCAFRPYTTLQNLGNLVGKDHATVLYYIKTHESQMLYRDYATLYERASSLCKTYYSGEYDMQMSYYDLLEEAEQLRSQVRELLKYKAILDNFKEKVDGF